MSGFEEIKERQRHMWTVGDFAKVATRTVPAAEAIVERLGIGAGERVLDVATGTGNGALVAAGRGARVSGLDLTPKLLGIAAERAAAAGAEIDFVEGDAEALPYDDDSFDAVISMFGVMFAPNQQQAADELVRVCRPGGRIGVAAWTPAGSVGQLFMLLAQHLPPPPEGFQPPILWGLEDHVRGLFAASGATITCTPRAGPLRRRLGRSLDRRGGTAARAAHPRPRGARAGGPLGGGAGEARRADRRRQPGDRRLAPARARVPALGDRAARLSPAVPGSGRPLTLAP